MSNTIQHTKTKQYTQVDEVTTEITSKSYAETLTKVKTEVSKSIRTNQNDLLKDVITCLSAIHDTEEQLTITINKKFGRPVLIIQTWTVKGEYYGK